MGLSSTLDLIKAIAELAKAVAWPSAVLIIVWWFRKPLFQLVNRLKRLKYKDIDAEFGEELAELHEISKWVAPGEPPEGFLESVPATTDGKAASKSPAPESPFTDSLPANLERLVVQAPLEAVVTTWNKVEGAVTMFVAAGAAAPSPFPSILRTLAEKKLIRESTRDVVIGLRHLRNLAARGGRLRSHAATSSGASQVESPIAGRLAG